MIRQDSVRARNTPFHLSTDQHIHRDGRIIPPVSVLFHAAEHKALCVALSSCSIYCFMILAFVGQLNRALRFANHPLKKPLKDKK